MFALCMACGYVSVLCACLEGGEGSGGMGAGLGVVSVGQGRKRRGG